MPGLLSFLLLTVYVLERLLPGKAGQVGGMGGARSTSAVSRHLQVSFLWPWGKM